MSHNKLFPEGFGKRLGFSLKVDKCPYMYTSENGLMPLRHDFQTPSMFSRYAEQHDVRHSYVFRYLHQAKRAENVKQRKHFVKLAERSALAALYRLFWSVLADDERNSLLAYTQAVQSMSEAGFRFDDALQRLSSLVGLAAVHRERAKAYLSNNSHPLFSERQLNMSFMSHHAVLLLKEKLKELQ